MFEEDVRGNFEGVGMEISIRDNILTVIAPLKGTPAEKLLPVLVRQRDKVKPHWADREFGEF